MTERTTVFLHLYRDITTEFLRLVSIFHGTSKCFRHDGFYCSVTAFVLRFYRFVEKQYHPDSNRMYIPDCSFYTCIRQSENELTEGILC